jgi:predicted SAM-dependent methyltransferase
MKLEIGCGDSPSKKNYKYCDIRCLPHIDYCCHVLNLNKFIKPNTLTHVYARHFLEHLTFKEANDTLRMLYVMMKDQGEIELIVPNILFHINQWINKKHIVKEFNHSKAGFWGWQREENKNYWDVHKSGYDIDTMKNFIENLGYVNFISLLDNNNQHLHVKFYKAIQ